MTALYTKNMLTGTFREHVFSYLVSKADSSSFTSAAVITNADGLAGGKIQQILEKV